ncbi:MAG TPA: murein biosynthesis integral membrane protein MurJ [Pseudolabrys sp.]|nr:murein biosynthesis integral membrane protein MurJ [Pseudolabrys sp.]
MSLARNVATVGSATLISRLLAYTRDAGIAALLGTSPYSEALFAVFQLVNFFRRLLAEGALNGAFVPIWLKMRAGGDGSADADRFTRRCLLAMLSVTGILALLAVALAPFVIATIAPGFDESRNVLASYLLIIVAFYVVLAGLAAVLAAALNAEGRVAAPAFSTAAFNMVMVAVVSLALSIDVPSLEIALWLSGAVVAAGFVQLVIALAAWLASGSRWRAAHQRVNDSTGTMFKRALPGLIAGGAPQLKLIAATAIVSSSPAAVSWLYYANRLYELPLGVASIATAAVIVPRIAATMHASDRSAYADAQSRAYEITVGLALPAAAAFALLAPQIAGGLFEHGAFGAADTEAVAIALIAICSGLPGHALEKVFAAVSFAHEDTRTPMHAALAGVAAAVIAGVGLFPLFGYIGAVAAVAMSAWVGALVLALVLYRRGWLRLDAEAAWRLPRIVLASMVMGAGISIGLVVDHVFFPMLEASAVGRLAVLFVLVGVGLAVYAAALQTLGVVKLADVVAAIRRAETLA